MSDSRIGVAGLARVFGEQTEPRLHERYPVIEVEASKKHLAKDTWIFVRLALCS